MPGRHASVKQSRKAANKTSPRRRSGFPSEVTQRGVWRQEVNYFEWIQAKLRRDPKYRDKFIAVLGEKIVGVGDDRFELYHRMSAAFPRRVLIEQATRQARHHVMTRHFPGQSIGLDLRTIDESQIAEMTQHLETAKVTIEGDKAVILGKETKSAVEERLMDIDWQLRRDHGHWKLDLSGKDSALTVIDDKVARGNNFEDSAMFHIMWRICPELRRVADEVESGKITNHDEAVRQATTAVGIAFQTTEKELRGAK